jgi:hypothetical protein
VDGATPSSLETLRRIAESVVIAVVSSAALYLVGFVYVDAYYGRLSLAMIPLDLPPPYVALQSIHAMWGLLDYPLTLVVALVVYRALASPSLPSGRWLGQARTRFPLLLPVLANLLLVAPLLLKSAASLRTMELPHRSALAEIRSVLGYAGLILLAYVLWLGWQRRYLLAELRARQIAPLALVFSTYLLSALVTTGDAAEFAAVDLLTGSSPGSVLVSFVMKPGVLPELENQELLLVAERSGTYYAVVREASPPDPWATSYAIPAGAIDAVRMRPFLAPESPAHAPS